MSARPSGSSRSARPRRSPATSSGSLLAGPIAGRRRGGGAHRPRGRPVRGRGGRDRPPRAAPRRRALGPAAHRPAVGRGRRPGRVRRGPGLAAPPPRRGRPTSCWRSCCSRSRSRTCARRGPPTRTRPSWRGSSGSSRRPSPAISFVGLARRGGPVLPTVRHRGGGAAAAPRLPRRVRAVDRLVLVRDRRGVHDRPAGDPARHLERRLERVLQRPAVDPSSPGDRVHGRRARADRHRAGRRPAAAVHQPARARADLLARLGGGGGLRRRSSSRSGVAMPTRCCGRCGAGSASRSSRADPDSATCSPRPTCAPRSSPRCGRRTRAPARWRPSCSARSPEEDARQALAAALDDEAPRVRAAAAVAILGDAADAATASNAERAEACLVSLREGDVAARVGRPRGAPAARTAARRAPSSPVRRRPVAGGPSRRRWLRSANTYDAEGRRRARRRAQRPSRHASAVAAAATLAARPEVDPRVVDLLGTTDATTEAAAIAALAGRGEQARDRILRRGPTDEVTARSALSGARVDLRAGGPPDTPTSRFLCSVLDHRDPPRRDDGARGDDRARRPGGRRRHPAQPRLGRPGRARAGDRGARLDRRPAARAAPSPG